MKNILILIMCTPNAPPKGKNLSTGPAKITFVMNHNPDTIKSMREKLKEHAKSLEKLTGGKRIVIAERRHHNTASLLFGRSSFSSLETIAKQDQKCGNSRCKSCKTMNLKRQINIEGLKIKLDFRLNCTTTNIIYLAMCKHCDPPGNFYFGQTINSCRARNNGHRDKFSIENETYRKSALSYHIYDKHIEHFDHKLYNYDIGIIKQVHPNSLDRAEDYFVHMTKADIISINRYKVIK